MLLYKNTFYTSKYSNSHCYCNQAVQNVCSVLQRHMGVVVGAHRMMRSTTPLRKTILNF